MNSERDDVHALDPQEQRLLRRALDLKPGDLLMFELASLGPAFILLIIGLIHNSHMAFVAGFGIIAAFRLWSLHTQIPEARIWLSILVKLCHRAGEAEHMRS